MKNPLVIKGLYIAGAVFRVGVALSIAVPVLVVLGVTELGRSLREKKPKGK